MDMFNENRRKIFLIFASSQEICQTMKHCSITNFSFTTRSVLLEYTYVTLIDGC